MVGAEQMNLGVNAVVVVREPISAMEELQAFYTSVGYNAAITENCVLVSARSAGEVVGLVRLAFEDGFQLLRGMMIAPAWQRKGIGTRMLHRLSEFMGSQAVYCLSHPWLEGFYGQVGFVKMDEAELPSHMAARLTDYRGRGYAQVALRRPGS